MKEVVSGEELKSVMSEAVNLLCDTVSSTLGPTGNNILINNSDTTPFITNDGVTIASNIESSDKRINTVLEIVKEASLKTNEVVGDGTTTTLVLLQSIFNQGLEEIKKGKNKIALKNELLLQMQKVLDLLNKDKRKPTKEDYLQVAYTSTNDLEISEVVTNTFLKMKSKYSIKLEESKKENTYTIHKKGYNIDIKNLSSIYFTNKDIIELKDVKVLILKGYLDSLESIHEIINNSLINEENIIIFVEAINEDIKNELLVYYLNKKNIFIVELEEYASRRDKIEEDIKELSKSIIKNIDYEEVSNNDCGSISSVIIKKDEVILSSDKNTSNKLVNKLKKELDNSNSDYEKDFIYDRLSKLEEGITTIYVGGVTKTSKREKLMRYEDALCALECAKDGISTGEGISYLKVSKQLNDNSIGEQIIKIALEKPFDKILENLGIEKNNIKEEIIKANYEKIYDYQKDILVNKNEIKIIDPTIVLITAFKNALSIAAILLSTSSLVINEEEIKETNDL